MDDTDFKNALYLIDGVGVAAIVVAVRTFLSFTLDVELEGRWPWQQTRPAPSGTS